MIFRSGNMSFLQELLEHILFLPANVKDLRLTINSRQKVLKYLIDESYMIPAASDLHTPLLIYIAAFIKADFRVSGMT